MPARTGPRLAWTGPLGWVALVTAALGTAGSAALGRIPVGGALVVVVFLVGSTPFLRRLGKGIEGFEIEGLLRLGLGLKFLAVLPRFELREDSVDYHAVGRVLARSFRRLDFSVDPGQQVPGTGSVRYLTGLVEVVTFDDEFATFAIFALAGFVGAVWFLRAFVTALPGTDPVRYAVLMMVWPSIVYWPSSTGKDAVMMFALGAAAAALARLLQGRWVALVPFIAAIGLAGLVRPHVALISVTAAVAAFVLHAPSRARTGVSVRFIVIGLLVVVGAIASGGVERQFHLEDLNPSGLTAALDIASLRSAQGGSAFAAARIDSIVDVPWGMITVFLRPFPHEAGSLPMLVTSLEGLMLAALLVGAAPRVAAAIGVLRRDAYIGYAITFVAIFVFLFSALGNFGILARQRTMMLPLVLLLVALPTARERVRARRAGSAS